MTFTLALLATLAGDWPHLRVPAYNGCSPEAGLAEAVAFAAYFWASGLLPVWRAVL